MALNFPNSPTIGQIYTDSTSGFSYEWTGTLWRSYSAATSSQIREIDNISGSFNGITTSFALTTGGASILPLNPQQLIVSVGGVIQNPNDDYTLSGSNIVFSTAPTAGLTFFATSLGPAQNIGVPEDGSVSPIKLSAGGPTWNSAGGLVVTGISTFNNTINAVGATFSGNVSIAGTLTYEDVTNVDSIGIVTARGGLIVGTGGTVITTTTSGNVGINSTVPQVKLDVVGGIKGTLVSETAQSASGLGTSVDFTGIPSWAKRVTVMLDQISTNGTSALQIQIGSGSIVTVGYLSSAIGGVVTNVVTGNVFGSGFVMFGTNLNDAFVYQGRLVLTQLSGSSNTWTANGSMSSTSGALSAYFVDGRLSLGGALDRVRITTIGGSDTFDDGTINIMYEG